MAGSWRHMVTGSGKLLNNERFCGMIENLGDAYEAAEECYGMVWWLASQVVDMTWPGEDDSPATRERCLEMIKTAQVNHREGLRIGGVQRDR